jgi:hypothetical protein
VRSRIIVSLILVAGWLLTGLPVLPLESFLIPPAVHAQESWEKEFHEICSRTDDAMTLSSEELRGFIDRCDAMKPQIAKLPEPGRKVYLRRLQMCRDLYAFTLDAKGRN